MLFCIDASAVMFVPVCVRLRDKEALYAAHNQPCCRTPPSPATYVAAAGCDEFAHDTAHDIYE